jgi:hypothetical protein
MGILDTAGKVLGVIGGVNKVISSNPTLNRLFGAGLGRGAEAADQLNEHATWTIRNGQTDFRVKVTLPSESSLNNIFFGGSRQQFKNEKQKSPNEVLSPLASEGGVIFPLTPSIIIQHAASYNAMALTHSNYPFYAYGHSEVPSFTVTGEFPVQNSEDAQYWVAMLHFFRSVTKMFFGGANDSLKGNPPPILQLNGYGSYVFNNVPVVVTNFNVDMRADVDYICTSQSPGRGAGGVNLNSLYNDLNPGIISDTNRNSTWAPALSTVTLQLQPVYSKESIKKFNMRDFVNGRLNGRSNEVGFI